MSLSADEQQVLKIIEDWLAASDPGLANRFQIFSRLASGESMPLRERIRPGYRPGASSRAVPPSRAWDRPRKWVRRNVVFLLFSVLGAVVAVLLAVGQSGGRQTCVAAWAMTCAKPVSDHGTQEASRSDRARPTIGRGAPPNEPGNGQP